MRPLLAGLLLLTACPDQTSPQLSGGVAAPGVVIVGCWTDYSAYTTRRCLYELDGRRGITGVGFPVETFRAGKSAGGEE